MKNNTKILSVAKFVSKKTHETNMGKTWTFGRHRAQVD